MRPPEPSGRTRSVRAAMVLACSCIGAAILVYVALWTAFPMSPPEEDVTGTSSSGSSVLVNDGRDPQRPTVAPRDIAFVDTRGGWGWSDKCWLYLHTGQLGWAKAACDKGMELPAEGPQPRASLLYNQGLIAKAVGDAMGAASAFRQSLALREHPEVRAALQDVTGGAR